MNNKYVPQMQERPLVIEPFETIAIDLVGPLPKGKGGCQFILTSICLATKWPLFTQPEVGGLTCFVCVAICWRIQNLLADQGFEIMRKIVLAAAIATSALGLAACSETAEEAGEAVDAMAADAEANAEAVADAAGEAADATAEAAGDAAEAVEGAVEEATEAAEEAAE